MEKNFLNEIKVILKNDFGETDSKVIFDKPLIQYLVKKTKSVNKGSKSRGSFANLYAIYVLIEDYINKNFDQNDKDYSIYEGAKYSDLLDRQRELPFGAKLQNHALNHRLNGSSRLLGSSADSAGRTCPAGPGKGGSSPARKGKGR